MTLDRFERIVLRLANQVPVRYWMHRNSPKVYPWIMALKVYPTHGFRTDWNRFVEDMSKHGLEYQDGHTFTAERTHDDGTPYTVEL